MKQNKPTKYLIVLIIILLISIGGVILGIKTLYGSSVTSGSILGLTTSEDNTSDPSYTFSTNRNWYIKSVNQKKYSTIKILFTLDNSSKPDTEPVYEIKNSSIEGKLEKSGDREYSASISANDLAPGTYKISAKAKFGGREYSAGPQTINVSYPVYVIWTMDWEGGDTIDKELNNLEAFSDKYSVPITHFFNPSIYTGTVSNARADEITDWIKDREEAGDEIGLHLHMHKKLVEAVGLEPKNKPQWTDYLDNGHDVPCSAYSYSEFKNILEWSIDTFEANGLERPLTFRAGGWFADLDNLKALDDTGFKADSSGREYYVWGSQGSQITGDWNLDITTQPYQPSTQNQNLSTPSPVFDLWEFPNNGGDSLYYNSDDLISRFDANYDSKIMSDYRVVTILSHPHKISEDIKTLEPFYKYLNKKSLKKDNGPVIYTTLLSTYNDIASE